MRAIRLVAEVGPPAAAQRAAAVARRLARVCLGGTFAAPSRLHLRGTILCVEAPMPTASIEENRLKDLLKSAIVEVLEERRDLVVEILEEAIEDVALVRAIEEGQTSAAMSREEVFKIFEQGE